MRIYSTVLAFASIALASQDAASNADVALANDDALIQMVQEIEALKSANLDLEEKYKQERDQVAALLSVVDELKVSSADMGSKHEQVVALEEDLESVRKASKLAEKNFRENTANLEKTLRTVSEAAKKSEDQRIKENAKSDATLKAIERVVEKLTKQLNDVNVEFALLKKKNAELEAQLGNVHADTSATTEELNTLNKSLQQKVSTLSTEKKSLKDKISELELQIHADQEQISTLEGELKLTKAQLAQINVLQNQLKDAKKQIIDLKEDLKKSDIAINWQAVFSSYYDQVAGAIENSDEYVNLAKTKTIEIYDSHVHPVTVEALKHATTFTSSARDLYKQHAAEHVDPLVDQIVLAAAPHYAEHYPVVEEYYMKLSEKVSRLSNTAEQRFRMTRKWCISRLKKLYPRISKYARQIVDTTIFLMTLPLIFAAFRIVVEAISLVLYLGTCCCCCGLVGRKQPTRIVAQPVATSTSTPPSSEKTEASTKKGKKSAKKTQ